MPTTGSPILRIVRRPAPRLAWSPGLALSVLILGTALLRVAASAALPLHQDEAYHSLFTKYPALSYYDHPPMVMWVNWAGVQLSGGVVSPFTVRLGFMLMMAASIFIAARLASRFFGEWAGVYAAAILALTGYHGSAGGMVFPESPLLFFTLLTMWAAALAVSAEPNRIRPWIGVGLAFGGAMLSKYFAVFLPAGVVLFAIVTPGRRRLLVTPGPYLAVAIGLLVFSPVIVWNATHEWASFAFQGERGTVWNLEIGHYFSRFGSTILWMFPWIWGAFALAGIATLRKWRTISPVERLLLCLAVVPLAAFNALGLVSPMMPHWPLYGYLPLIPLAGARIAEWSTSRPLTVRVGFTIAVLFAGMTVGVVVGQVRTGFIPLRTDPSAEIGCWDQVAEGLRQRGLTARTNTFFFTSKWCDSAQLEFALRAEPARVACYHNGDSRGYAYWSKPEDYLGMDGIYVAAGSDSAPPALFELFFRKVEKIAEIPLTRGSAHFGTAVVYLCTYQFDAFPFDGRTWLPKLR